MRCSLDDRLDLARRSSRCRGEITLRRYEWGSKAVYLLMGWAVIVFMQPLIAALDRPILTLLVSGGVLYSIGACIHHSRPASFPLCHLAQLGIGRGRSPLRGHRVRHRLARNGVLTSSPDRSWVNPAAPLPAATYMLVVCRS